MGTPYSDPIAVGILLLIGGLFVALLKRLNIQIKNPYVFTLILWGTGYGFAYLGYALYENQSTVYFSYLLLAMGGILLLASTSFFFFTMLNPPAQNKVAKQSDVEGSFAYRLGERVGTWVRRRLR